MSKVVGHLETRKRLEAMIGRVPPSLLFTGPTGIGKKLVALEFARRLTGETRALDLTQPMAQTESIFYISPDGANIKIDQVREALSYLSLARDEKPLVYIFDDAHNINPQAANALLKSVEEPPPGVHFIFVVPSAAMMLATIRSRSQIVRFAPLADDEVRDVLKTAAVSADAKTLAWALALASGSPGLAIEILSLAGGEAETSLGDAVDAVLDSCAPSSASDRASALASLREVAKERDLQVLALRILVRRVGEAWQERAGRAPKASSWLAKLPFEKLERATDLALEAEADLGRNVDRQLLWESLASRLSQL